jgi:tRNA-2-methylthio-N6-dimethylallyladenosine synthase
MLGNPAKSDIGADMPARKKLFVKTFGCQMNVYDSERMADVLAPLGYVPTAQMDDADVVVLNTCHIREKAGEKVYSELGRVRQVKLLREQQGLKTIVAVAGCVAQAEGQEIARRAPIVDLVIGPQSYHRLPDLIFQVHQGGGSIVDTDFPTEGKFKHLPKRRDRGQASAFLTVQEGCDKFCTFCVVPYTRGMEYSRPVAQVRAEAQDLVARGVSEITLLGQNVNAYHGAGPNGGAWSLARLLEELSGIEGLQRLRYTTSHPRDMDDALISAHRDLPKLMPYLHLPFQAGSDRILAAMNRKHTARDYLDLVQQLRDVCPDIALSTDIIVGFPGETEAEFAATLAIVNTVGFAQAYSFKYSARPGTPAAALSEQVDEDVQAERLSRLQDILNTQQQSFNAGCVGQTFDILFERKGRRDGQLVGRSPYLQAVHATADIGRLGRIMPVEITGAGPKSLAGVIKAA